MRFNLSKSDKCTERTPPIWNASNAIAAGMA